METTRNNEIDSIIELFADKFDADAMSELELIRHNTFNNNAIIQHNTLHFSDRPLLTIACDLNLPRAVAILIAAGADVNAQSSFQFTPLHAACNRNNKDIVVALLEAGADPSIRAGVPGWIPQDLTNCNDIKNLIKNFGGGRATKAAVS